MTSTTATTKPAADYSEFDSDEFEDTRQSLPYIQILNDKRPEDSGFFITMDNADAVEFAGTPEDGWEMYQATFRNGETADGFRSLTARLLVLKASNLLMYDRESGEFIGEFAKGKYDRKIMTIKRKYLVYICGKDKKPLHKSPLQFTAKGSISGSFGDAFNRFQAAMSKAFGVATGARKARGAKFMALSIFAIKLEPKLKGDKEKSWVCDVADVALPTDKNWEMYFVGKDETLKEQIFDDIEANADFGTSLAEAAPVTPTAPVDEFVDDEAAGDIPF